MFAARTLSLSFSVIIMGAAIGCTTSEPYMPTAGGSTGSGSGGATMPAATGTGGATGTVTTGTGGATGSGGAPAGGSGGAGVDAAPMDVGGGTAEVAAPAVTFAKDVGPILMTKCMPCHTKAAGNDGNNFTVTTLASVTGMTTSKCTKVDASMKRVVAGNPMASYLYIKISTPSAMLGGACGVQMPKMGGYLAAADQMTIMNWIMQGAN